MKNAETKKGGGLGSILFKMMAVVIVVVMFIVAPLSVLSFRTADQVAHEGVHTQGHSVTQLAARNIRAAVKFRKAEPIQELFTSIEDSSGGAYVSGIVTDADGVVIASYGVDDPLLVEVAQTVLETNEEILRNNDLTIGAPVAGGDDAPAIGTIVIAWSDATLVASVWPKKMTALGVACVVFVAGVVGIVLFMRYSVTKPMHRLNNAVDLVSKARYDTEVPGTARRDEIGIIAKSLDGFREQLSAGAAMARESSFKGAAFEGSSAALMMVDADFKVIAVNPAVRKLLGESHAAFPNANGFDPEALENTHIKSIHPDGDAYVGKVENCTSFPLNDVLSLGDLRMTVETAAVHDTSGEKIGYVIEWLDVTEDFLTKGVLDAIHGGQVTAQFALSGSLIECNENFARLLESGMKELRNAAVTDLVSVDKPSWEDLLATQQPLSGRFDAKTASGTAHHIEGSFSIVRDVDGKPLRVALIANDVTASVTELERSNIDRARIEKALAQVVAALRDGLKKLSDGDLTFEISNAFDADYESLRSDFNEAMVKLREAIVSVIENTQLIQNESSEISNAADDLALRTERQASTLEETATALDQLTSSVQSAADGANRASKMVSDAKRNAEDSGRVVDEAVEAMGEIEASSDKISKITSLIDDIAFQTNLLALNAGVEAARAGEAGRGFAVVASEVRALAQRSSDAAREINALISSSGAQVKRGVDLVGQAGQALRGIVASVSEIATHVDEIAISSAEQSTGLGEINASVNQLDQVTQQNAAMFEETTAASHALRREVETLKETTSRFHTGTPPVTANVVSTKFAATKPAANEALSAPQAAESKIAVNAPVPSAQAPIEDGWEDF